MKAFLRCTRLAGRAGSYSYGTRKRQNMGAGSYYCSKFYELKTSSNLAFSQTSSG